MNVYALIVRRLLVTIPILLGVTVMTFAVSHAIPGDPARALAGMSASAETVAQIREEWGLNDSVPQQYVAYLGNLFQGDLGRSMQTGQPVTEELARRIPATLELTLFALVCMCVLGIALGVLGAVRRNRGGDHLARVVAVAGGAIPSFWLALILQLVFFKMLGWLPATGRLSDSVTPPPDITGFLLVDSVASGNWPAFLDSLRHLLLPGFTLALLGIAGVTRMTRSSMLEVLDKDYVRAARGRGLGRRTVILGYALRNALIPTVTVIGLLFGAMIGGALVIEWIFVWPGLGSYAASAITSLDYSVVLGVTLVIAVIYVVANLVVDVSYLVLNPRTREG